MDQWKTKMVQNCGGFVKFLVVVVVAFEGAILLAIIDGAW